MGLPTTGVTLPLFLPQLLSTPLSISLLFLPQLLSMALSISLLFLPQLLPTTGITLPLFLPQLLSTPLSISLLFLPQLLSMSLSISSLTRQNPFPIVCPVAPVFLPYAVSMLLSVTPLVLQPLGSMRCPVAPVGLRPRGSWGRSEGRPFGTVIIAFVVLDGGSAGAQLSFGRHGELGSMRPVAPVSFRPPGSLGRSEGCLFGRGSAFLALVRGSAGAQFSFGRHRERVAVLVEGCLAV